MKDKKLFKEEDLIKLLKGLQGASHLVIQVDEIPDHLVGKLDAKSNQDVLKMLSDATNRN